MRHFKTLPRAYAILVPRRYAMGAPWIYQFSDAIESLSIRRRLCAWATNGVDRGELSAEVVPDWLWGALGATGWWSGLYRSSVVPILPSDWVDWFLALPPEAQEQYRLIHALGGPEAVSALADANGRPMPSFPGDAQPP